MKNKIIISALAVTALMFSSCGGNRSGDYGMDSAKAQSHTDTAAVTTSTGDATNIDNSGSGGTKVARDTSQQAKHDSTKK